MKRIISIPFALLLITFCFSSVYSQNDKGSKVKTKFLQLPGYDMSTVDPSTISSYFVAGPSTFGTEKLKDTKSICVPKNGGIKDAIEISTYYYEVPINAPASYLVAKDGTGKVVYATKVSDKNADVVKFGFEKCEYWIADKMKKDWAAQKEQFKNRSASKTDNGLFEKASLIAKTNIFPSVMDEEFQVFTAKGKDHDYTELNETLEMAEKAYASFASDGPNATAFQHLNDALGVWKKTLDELDLENKKARINKNVAKGLYENLMNAYMYTYQSREALKAGMAAKKLYGNFSNNRTIALDARVQMIGTLEIASDQNAALVADMTKLNEVFKNAGGKNATVEMRPKEDLPMIEKEYNLYRAEVYSEKMGSSKEIFEESVAAGDVNRYDQYVTKGVTGKMIMMSPLTMAPKLDEFPKEICEITDLQQVMITGNNIASVPAEIGNLKDLDKLVLTKNKLTTLPDEIGELSKLKTLNVGNNPITSLPESIKNCSSLKSLNIKGTKLSSDQIKDLETLLPNVKIKY